MMLVNDYGNEVERWKVELIVARARRFGFRRHDLEDLQQELILDIAAFSYDASRSNGATERTAVTALIDHRLKTVLRANRRYRDHLERLEPPPDAHENRDVSRRELALDVEEAMSGLSADDRQLCAALAAGRSVAGIARSIGCSWHTVIRRMRRIRRHFETVGLDVTAGE